MNLRGRYPSRVLALLSLLAGLAGPVAAQTTPPDELALDESLLAERGVRPEEGDVGRLYEAVFGRIPDQPGFEFWVIARIEGLPLERVADFFIDSPEYRARFGEPEAVGFVEQLYESVLDRAPDAGGRLFWLDQLAEGMERRQMVVLFSESPEFIDITGTVAPAYADGMPTFSAARQPVTVDDLGASWRLGCPVGPDDLVHLDVAHIAADGSLGHGRLTVHRDVAEDVTVFFAELYRLRVPVTAIVPAAAFDGDDDAMMAVNNTSGFNCRAVVGGSGWSRHAFGRAIDINPLVNPYVRGDLVLPPTGAPWVDRAIYAPGMLRDNGAFVSLVRSTAGWRWGGDWSSLKDYQHIDISP